MILHLLLSLCLGLLLSGCSSSQITSKRLTLAVPAKVNSDSVELIAKYDWIDQPYVVSLFSGMDTLPIKGHFVYYDIDHSFCGDLIKQDPDKAKNKASADMLLEAQWQSFGQEKLSSLISSLANQYHVPDIKVLSTPNKKLDVKRSVAEIIVTPMFVAMNAINTPLHAMTGDLKDKTLREDEKRKSFVADQIIEADARVTYALLKVKLTYRRESLLYPVDTPYQLEDWGHPIEYMMLFAVNAPDADLGRMALCGIPSRQYLPTIKE